MSPDVARAIPDLQERGQLTDAEARLVLRVARGELVSVFHELRWLLYAGVVLVVAGVGELVRENLDRLGPVAVAFGIALVAAIAFTWVQRSAPAFSWGPASSSHVAFDYVLLLAVLLAAADLAYVEAELTPLGPNWPWHLLFVSLAMAAISVRFDSRVVFSLALSTFASWRGVSVSFLERGFWSNFATAARLNTVSCGILFVVIGWYLAREERKAHFEPVATYLGVLLALAALASGALTDEPSWSVWSFALLVAGGTLAVLAFSRRRFPLFAIGTLSVYVALSRFIVPGLHDDMLVFLWFLLTSLAAIVVLIRFHGRLGKAT